MSELKVNKISPRTACGTTTLGDSGDTFTIPSGVSITNLGTASGFGATGETSWVTTVKTSTFTATAGEGYFCDTTSGVFTVNLPAGAAGASVAVADYAGTFNSSALTISPNGTEKIGGVNADVTLSTEGQSATFVYVDSTQGWVNVIDSTSNIRGNAFLVATGGTVTTSGNDKIHTFTGPGTFAVSNTAVCATQNIVSYLVVAGGGSGAKGNGGGGGAGGYRELKNPVTPYTASPLDGYPTAPNRVTVTATSFPITVGGGAAATTSPYNAGTVGSNSIFSTITSAGGGFGAAYPAPCGGNGGSGGGAGANTGTGGSGNTPPTTPAQGQNGGGSPSAPPICGAAGGGGAGAVGANKGSTTGGAGGAGVTSEINASPVQRAGGGGGWGRPGPGGAGGGGGGGAGGREPPGVAAGCGTANTGGGGGGLGNPSPGGGAGGSGIVIIRYKFQ